MPSAKRPTGDEPREEPAAGHVDPYRAHSPERKAVRPRSSRTSHVAAPGEAPSPEDPLLAFTPVPHKAPRRNSITAERQRAFISHLAATGIVRQAAKQIGASVEALYTLRHRPGGEEFSAAWDAAIDRGVQRLEDCALARAIEGEERMVVSGGKVLGTERRHNNALVMFFLRQRRPERYGTDVKPGHPVYERIRAEVLAGGEGLPSEREVIDSINRKIDAMRERERQVQEMLRADGIGVPIVPSLPSPKPDEG